MLKRHWEEDERFELVTDPYFNPIKAAWADVTWVEWCEGSAVQAAQRKGEFKGMYDDFTDPQHKTPIDWSGDWSNTKLIIRPIDIDVHYGHFRGVDWNNVDHVVFIAKHIQEMMMNDPAMKDRYPELPVHHIPLSIDLTEWTYKDRTKTRGKNIAFVNHLWSGKGIPFALQVMKKVVDKDPEFKLHFVGSWSNEFWLPDYVKHMIQELKLTENIEFHPRVPVVDNFLQEMDYTLSTSYKEAFSLITAEGMAKGIKPVIHNWKGSKDIWPEKFIFNTVDEAAEMILNDEYSSEEYAEYVKRYDWKQECERADTLLIFG